MVHIATITNEEERWQKLSDIISEYHGKQFHFDSSKVYRIQNLGSSKLLVVESENELEHAYNEGEVYIPNAFITYTPTDGLDLWIRSADINRITITEILPSQLEQSIVQINDTLGQFNNDLQEI